MSQVCRAAGHVAVGTGAAIVFGVSTEVVMFAKRILVPTDFSVCSKTALHLAVALANGEEETTVVVLHVVEPAVPSYDDELGVLEPEALRTEFEVLAASRDHNVQIDAEICYGEPAEEILTYAEKHNIDLIVMGTHGSGDLIDFLVGDTAKKVMRKAKCPVLTVRDDSVVPAEPTATE